MSVYLKKSSTFLNFSVMFKFEIHRKKTCDLGFSFQALDLGLKVLRGDATLVM